MSNEFKISSSISFEPIHLKIDDDGKVMWKVNSGSGFMQVNGVRYNTKSTEWVELFNTMESMND